MQIYFDIQNRIIKNCIFIISSSNLPIARTPILRSPMADLTDISEPYPVHEAYPGPPPAPAQPLSERY